MSHLVARIMLALLMLPLATVLYLLVLVPSIEQGGYGPNSENNAFLAASLASAIFIAVYWTLLWRKTVRWSMARTRWTVAAAFVAVAVGAVAGAVAGALASPGEQSFGILIGGMVTILSWLALSVPVWRETAEERRQRVQWRGGAAIVCPSCGYNLTGLTQSICPECGARYSIDELLAQQPSSEQSELE